MKNWQESNPNLISMENILSMKESSAPIQRQNIKTILLPKQNCSTLQQYSVLKQSIKQEDNSNDQQKEVKAEKIYYNSKTSDLQSNSSNLYIEQNLPITTQYDPHSSNYQHANFSSYLSSPMIMATSQQSKPFQPSQVSTNITDNYQYTSNTAQPYPLSQLSTPNQSRSHLTQIKTVSNKYPTSSSQPYCPHPSSSMMQPNTPGIPKSSTSNNRIRWTKQEDEQLLSLVRRWGARRWNEIAASLGTKTAKQCRDHYANCLDPGIRNSLWTVEEEEILLSKYNEIGPHWSRIRSFFPGRTNAMIKNYTIMLLKKNGKEMPIDIQSQKDKSESESEMNSSSGNEDNDDFAAAQKNESPIKQNQFSVNDINFLLNRPAKFDDSA